MGRGTYSQMGGMYASMVPPYGYKLLYTGRGIGTETCYSCTYVLLVWLFSYSYFQCDKFGAEQWCLSHIEVYAPGGFLMENGVDVGT